MTPSTQAERVRALVEPVIEAGGLVVEDVTVTPAGRRRVLRVVVDLPADRTGGVPMDDVARVSQALSAALDGSDVMGGAPYVLEVTSPGVDRPLTDRRHWSRARGRLVRVQLASGGETSGRLTGVDDDGLHLDGDRRLTWHEVRRGRVEVEFSRADGDTSAGNGADLGETDLDERDLDAAELDDDALEEGDLEEDDPDEDALDEADRDMGNLEERNDGSDEDRDGEARV